MDEFIGGTNITFIDTRIVLLLMLVLFPPTCKGFCKKIIERTVLGGDLIVTGPISFQLYTV